jgi:hypothetical protein
MYWDRKKTVATAVTAIALMAMAMIAYTVQTGDWRQTAANKTAKTTVE